MKRFACGDVVPGCSTTFTAPDEAGIFAQVAPHAAAEHGLHDITPELQATVRSLISAS